MHNSDFNGNADLGKVQASGEGSGVAPYSIKDYIDKRYTPQVAIEAVLLLANHLVKVVEVSKRDLFAYEIKLILMQEIQTKDDEKILECGVQIGLHQRDVGTDVSSFLEAREISPTVAGIIMKDLLDFCVQEEGLKQQLCRFHDQLAKQVNAKKQSQNLEYKKYEICSEADLDGIINNARELLSPPLTQSSDANKDLTLRTQFPNMHEIEAKRLCIYKVAKMYLEDEFRCHNFAYWEHRIKYRTHVGPTNSLLLDALKPRASNTSVMGDILESMLKSVSPFFSDIFHPQPANATASTSATTTTLTTTTMTTTTGSTGVISATHPATQTPNTASLAQVVVIEPQAAAVATVPLPIFPPVPTTPLVHVEQTVTIAQQNWTVQEESKNNEGKEKENEIV